MSIIIRAYPPGEDFKLDFIEYFADIIPEKEEIAQTSTLPTTH